MTFLTLVALLQVAGPPPVEPADPVADLPPVFSTLAGAWEGTGTLMGRPGAFEMEWKDGGAGFVHLSFSNGWLEDGTLVPVMASRATYLFSDSAATGVWIDDRPQRLTLEAVATDSSVVTRWTAAAEEGRTEYVVRSPTSVSVRDFVLADGAYRLFAEATYRRKPVGGARLRGSRSGRVGADAGSIPSPG